MVALIALRLPVLGFCLCEDDLILNDGTCCLEHTSAAADCGCCPEEIACLEEEPCQDCVVVLSLDPGEFVWSADRFSPAQEQGAPLALPAGFQDDSLPETLPGRHAGPIRGSPRALDLPVHLRSEVLKL